MASEPSLWWKYAGRAAARETARISRRQVRLADIGKRHPTRVRYQALYASTHAGQPSFLEPKRRWWQRPKVKHADEAAKRQLAELDDQLSAEDIAYYRWRCTLICLFYIPLLS